MRRRAALALLALPSLARAAAAGPAEIERDSGGRLGLLAWDTGSNRRWAHREGERFPMASTVKAPLGAMALERPAVLAQSFDVPPRAALVPWSPVTESHAGAAMTGAALVAAMLETSDNTATNLLLGALGGPAGFTAWLRAGGDGVTRLDRTEPALNEATPGDGRDTTTPAAMAETLARLTLGPGGAPFVAAMRAHRFGGALLRAGMPGWTLADRSGAGGHGTRGVVAHAVPPGGGAPWIIAAYLHEGPAALPARDAVLARIGAWLHAQA